MEKMVQKNKNKRDVRLFHPHLPNSPHPILGEEGVWAISYSLLSKLGEGLGMRAMQNWSALRESRTSRKNKKKDGNISQGIES
jgi:hypothetical protein